MASNSLAIVASLGMDLNQGTCFVPCSNSAAIYPRVDCPRIRNKAQAVVPAHSSYGLTNNPPARKSDLRSPEGAVPIVENRYRQIRSYNRTSLS